MNNDRRRVLDALLAAIADVNEQLPKERRLATAPNVVLCGEGGALDSLGLLNFMLAAERRLEDAGYRVNLTAIPNAGDSAGPLRDIATLAEYVCKAPVRP